MTISSSVMVVFICIKKCSLCLGGRVSRSLTQVSRLRMMEFYDDDPFMKDKAVYHGLSVAFERTFVPACLHL